MIDLKKIQEAKNTAAILEEVMNALHDVGGTYFARKAVNADKAREFGVIGGKRLTAPIRKSMEEKSLSDEQIEKYALDVWEAAAIRMSELERMTIPPDRR